MEKLSPFDAHDVAYKTVKSTPIEATILLPKATKPGKHPILVRWHGGFLVTGARMFLPFFHQWMLDFAQKHSAIVVVPDYRLMPESTGLEILEDVADFWTWVNTKLPTVLSQLSPGVEADLSSIAVIGESAGGYLSIQSALLHPELTGIKAIVAAYPVIDVTTPFWTETYEKVMMGFSQQPASVVSDHLAAIKPGAVVPADPTLSRSPLAFAIVQNGRYLEFLGKDEKLQPLKNLEKFKGDLPFLFAYHGRQDSAVPVEGTEKWEALLKKVRPDGKWRVAYEDGEHGFDGTAALDTPWLKNGLKEVEKYWPGTSTSLL
jgi:acetyl esterase/lipase